MCVPLSPKTRVLTLERAENKFSHATRSIAPLHREKDKARRILTLSAEKIFSLGREKKGASKKGERSLTF